MTYLNKENQKSFLVRKPAQKKTYARVKSALEIKQSEVDGKKSMDEDEMTGERMLQRDGSFESGHIVDFKGNTGIDEKSQAMENLFIKRTSD